MRLLAAARAEADAERAGAAATAERERDALVDDFTRERERLAEQRDREVARLTEETARLGELLKQATGERAAAVSATANAAKPDAGAGHRHARRPARHGGAAQ